MYGYTNKKILQLWIKLSIEHPLHQVQNVEKHLYGQYLEPTRVIGSIHSFHVGEEVTELPTLWPIFSLRQMQK